MSNINLDYFLTSFFTANQCKIEKPQEGMYSIQLTEEMDKALMNRPFYWHYIKSIGEEGNPMMLHLITDPNIDKSKGEWVHFGSPRLLQIWNHLVTNEKYVHLFEEVHTQENTPLYPWLLLNIKISYEANQKKEELISIGVQLINGKMIVNMMDELERRNLKQNISNYCFTLSPLITVKNGYLRIEKVILDYIKNQEKDWALNAQKKLEEELDILQHFYSDNTNQNLFEKEVAELHERYSPVINIEVVNGGILYLLGSFAE
ncbi:YqhG family protein [Oceanobacillus sp. CAU 1775]